MQTKIWKLVRRFDISLDIPVMIIRNEQNSARENVKWFYNDMLVENNSLNGHSNKP